MHTRVTPVSGSADSTDSACPARPDLTAPHAPTASSPAATFFTAPASARAQAFLNLMHYQEYT